MRSYFSIVVAGLLVLPLAAVSWAAATGVAFRGHAGVETPSLGRVVLTRETSFYARPLLLMFGFSAVTVAWLVVLIKALQGKIALLRGFLGDVDLTAYVLPMPELRTSDRVLIAAAVLTPLLRVAATAAACGSAGRNARIVPVPGVTRHLCNRESFGPMHPAGCSGRMGSRPAWSIYAGTGSEHSGVLFLYLPTLAFWAAFAKLLLSLRREQTTLTGSTVLRLWYLSAGSALLLNQYPRMDSAHMVWSVGCCWWGRGHAAPLVPVSATTTARDHAVDRPSGRGTERSAPADHGGSPSGVGSPPWFEPVRDKSSCIALPRPRTRATLCATDSAAGARFRLGA